MLDARKRLAEYARASLKLDAVDLFAEVGSAEGPGYE
jgi:hypothetical protein